MLIKSLLVDLAAQPEPSYDELLAALTVAHARIAALEELVADLSRKLGVDSQNSSKPPSSDGPGARAERRRAERTSVVLGTFESVEKYDGGT